MVKVIGPALSLDASKSLGKTATFQRRPSGNSLYLYNKPGDRTKYVPNWRQRNQRGIRGLIVARWQSFSQSEKDQWDLDAKSAGISGSGYHYFLSLAQTNLYHYLGLCGYWSFNEGSGCRTLDLSGQGNHGDLSPTCPSNSPLWVDSQNEKFGTALQFDATNRYVQIASSASLKITKEFYIEFWVKKLGNAEDVYGGIWWDQLEILRSRILIGSAGNALAQIVIGGVTVSPSCANGKVPNQKYTHIALLYNGSEIVFYINAIKQTPVSASGQVTISNSSRVIGKGYAGGFYFNGIIDEVRIFNRALTDLEILKHYEMFS